MNFFSFSKLACWTALAISSSASLFGQEYFRELNTQSELRPATRVNEAATEDKYNLSVGPVRLNVAAGVGVEFNDNIQLSNKDRLSDIILRPSVSLEATWRITDLNTLRLSIGASYAKYFSHSQYDSRSMLLTPNSALAFSIKINDSLLTFRDQFSYQEDPFDLPLLSNVGNYRRFENRAGVQYDWPLNPNFSLTLGYVHYNLWTFDKQFSSLDRSIDTLFIRPTLAIAPTISVGLDTSINYINYSDSLENDGLSYLIAPFIEWAITPYTHLTAEVGYQKYDFSNSGTLFDSPGSNTLFYKGDVTNLLTPAFRHHLSFSRSTELGFQSDVYELYHLEYGADWAIMRNLSLQPTLFYEHYTTSGDIGEKADRYGTAVGLRYILTPSVTAGFDYRYLRKKSNFPDADYTQNLVLLSLFYNF